MKEEQLYTSFKKDCDKYKHQPTNLNKSTPKIHSIYLDKTVGNPNSRMNVSLCYGTPSIQQFLGNPSTRSSQRSCVISRTASRSRHRPPIEVITLDSSHDDSTGTLEIAHSQEDDSVVILEHSNNEIKRSSSVNDKSIIVISDTPLKPTAQEKRSLPITPTSSKPRRVVRRIDFDCEEKPSMLLRSGGRIRHLNVNQTFSQGSDTSAGSDTISVCSEGRRKSIGTEPLKIATESVQMQKYFNLMNGGEWCDKDSKVFMGSKYRYETEVSCNLEEGVWTYAANDIDTMDLCYHAFFETYTSSTKRGFHTTKEELVDLWLAILDFLEESISSAEGNPDEYPSIATIHSILFRGVRENSNVNVRHAAFGFMQRLVLYQHPLRTPGMRNYYKKLFVRKTNCTVAELNNFDAVEMWDFFNELIEETVEVCYIQHNVENSGLILFVEIILMILGKTSVREGAHFDF